MFVSEEMRKKWENAGPNNAFIFAQLMQVEENCIGVLETFLNVKIDHIEYLETEKVIEESYNSKGIRLDVYVKDEAGSVYNVEMQRKDRYNLPKRCRYYQSLIDINCLEKSADYEDLCKSFVIFICNYDPFEKDRCVYSFENRDAADPDLKLGDETTKLIFYTKGGNIDKIDPRLRKILQFFDDQLPEKTSEDPLMQSLIDTFYRIKSNKLMEEGFMTQAVREHDWRKEGYADGYESARSELQPLLMEKENTIAEDKVKLAEKDHTITEKENTIAEKDDEIAQLKDMVRELMSKLQKNNE